MIKETTWMPIYCSCSISYTWDNTLPDDQIILTPVRAVHCERHATLSLTELMVALQDESRTAELPVLPTLPNSGE